MTLTNSRTVLNSVLPVGSTTRVQLGRGMFALEPMGALAGLANRIDSLAERALETNPFFLPEFLEPAIQALGRERLRLAVFFEHNDLRFFTPVVPTGRYSLSAGQLSVWAHDYAPLGTPLIDREMAPQVAYSLMDFMRERGRTVFSIPHLPLDGPVASVLRKAAERAGFSTVAERQMRPVLSPHSADRATSFEQTLSAKRRRDLDRLLRRLCETGPVNLTLARTATEIEAAFDMFAELEGRGWKGRRGTAMICSPRIHKFAQAAVVQLARKGLATIDVLRVGQRPIAALIRIDHAGLSIPWKITFDETYAAFSPGKQLMCDATRRWLLDRSVERVDPVCEEDNRLMSLVWPGRKPYGTLLLSTSPWGLGARLRAGCSNLKMEGKALARSLLQGWRRKRT